MGIYSVLFAVAVGGTVLLVASLFVGLERAAKIAGGVLTNITGLLVVGAVLTYFSFYVFGIGCWLFNWCPLVK